MRSRAVILPLACCFSMAASPDAGHGLVVALLEVGELARGGEEVGAVGRRFGHAVHSTGEHPADSLRIPTKTAARGGAFPSRTLA